MARDNELPPQDLAAKPGVMSGCQTVIFSLLRE